MSQPGDRDELEADRLAASALEQADLGDSTSSVDRGKRIRRQATSSRPTVPSDPSPMAGGLTLGPGEPLSSRVLGFFAPRFDSNFESVRIHRGSEAAKSADAHDAKAFAVGHHIVFGGGQFAPETPRGKMLLAHELAHVVQHQRSQGCERRIRRRWDQPTTECDAEPKDRFIERITIDQQTPQSITLHWSNSSEETFQCSTGKGQCCVDPSEPNVVGCSIPESRRSGSNCTPITLGTGYPVVQRFLSRNGWKFWTDIVVARGIGMHQYPVKDGTPLSHGCIRLDESVAQRIFCGVRKDVTRVRIENFARPRCDHAQLIREWQGDFSHAATPTDGEPSDVQRGILETRKTLRQAFRVQGLDSLLATPRADIAGIIPRCSYLAPDAESARLERRSGETRSPGERLIAGAGLSSYAKQLGDSLKLVTKLSDAENVVSKYGRRLWAVMTSRARKGNSDDRPLYWARLQMVEAIQQVRFQFLSSPDQRRQLIGVFERASRGMQSVSFSSDKSQKRILISGFDPFGLSSRGNSNPSGAAALALDGRPVSAGGVTARVESVVFPVRYRDFDQGLVESFFRPFLDGTNPVDMIMTISQGETDYEVEEFAGRRRSAGGFADNAGATTSGTTSSPIAPPGLASGDEFLETELPTTALRGALGRSKALDQETEVTELSSSGKRPARRLGGPTGGAAGFTGIASKGSGGGFLSNEISYRTLLLRGKEKATIPVGHLHVPALPTLESSKLSSEFVRKRNEIVETIRKILKASLPSI